MSFIGLYVKQLPRDCQYLVNLVVFLTRMKNKGGHNITLFQCIHFHFRPQTKSFRSKALILVTHDLARALRGTWKKELIKVMHSINRTHSREQARIIIPTLSPFRITFNRIGEVSDSGP